MTDKKGFTLIELMIVIAIIAILAAILVPNFMKARAQGRFTACESNLKTIATSLQIYSTDSGGHYPATGQLAEKLVPEYIKEIPACPSQGADSYSSSYTSALAPDAFTLYCVGGNHTAVGVTGDYPQYTSAAGLIPGR